MTGSGLRLGLVLALFSFVGFESATTLGAEARDPLKTIPRAVIQSSILAGAFFIAVRLHGSARISHRRPGSGNQPGSHARSGGRGRRAGAGIIDRHRCAGQPFRRNARLHHGRGARSAADVTQRPGARLVSQRRTRATKRPAAPSWSQGSLPFLPVAVLALRGASGLDVYGWMGSLATYGFIVTYALVCVALPRYFRDHGCFSPSGT